VFVNCPEHEKTLHVSLYTGNCRAAQLQALQPPTNYYQQTPLQQTGFYQAQQTGSALQVHIYFLYHSLRCPVHISSHSVCVSSVHLWLFRFCNSDDTHFRLSAELFPSFLQPREAV